MCISVVWCPEQIIKTVVVAVMLAGMIPLLLGLLFELVIVAPLRVPLDQTPLFYPWQVGLWIFYVCENVKSFLQLDFIHMRNHRLCICTCQK